MRQQVQPERAAVSDQSPTVIYLQMRGEYDLANKDSLSAMLLPGEAADTVVIDMADTRYIDSSALHCLVHLKTQLLSRGGVVQLVGVSPNICRLFAVTGLDGLFEISG
jgi:anti-sigma B factor antagonist